jgi:hypothetical protein
MKVNMTTDRTTTAALTPRPRRRIWLTAAAVAAALVALLIALTLSDGGGSDIDAAQAPLEPLVLSVGAGDAMASCLPVDANTLAEMAPAFAATATAVGDDMVTLDIDRWYTDGDATQVRLHAESGQAALIAGFDFALGEEYLITASEGTVNFCGYSGPATPELAALFDRAFVR